MRVSCEKCGAAYAVDDKLIPAKGARAQCPKCKALQVVRRPAPGAAPAPARSAAPPPAARGPAPAPAPTPAPARLPAAAQAAPRGPAPATPQPSPRSAAGQPLRSAARAPAPSRVGPPPAAPAADLLGGGAARSSASSDPFEIALAPAPAPPPPSPAAPFDRFDIRGGRAGSAASPPPDPFAPASSPSLPDPFGPESAPALDPFADLSGPAAPKTGSFPSQPGIEELFGPAKGLSGAAPFALEPARPAAPEPAALAQAEAQGPVIRCRVCSKPLPDPLDAALGVCEVCRSNESSLPSAAPRDSSAHAVERIGAPGPVDPFGEAAAAPSPALQNAAPMRAAPAPSPRKVRRPVENAMRPEAGGRGRLVLGGALALAVAAALAWIVVARPAQLFGRGKPKAAVPAAVEKRLAGWRLAIDTAGDAKEHFARGRRLFLEDKPASYIQAEEEFKAAVALDPGNLAAVAHLVEAFATGRGERASAEALAEARELIGAVLAARPELSVAHRAKAALLLAEEAFDAAPAEAAQALKLAAPEEQAEALLMVGRTYLTKSAEIALERFEGALKKDRSLKRAHYYRGLAAENAGRYAQAVAALEERLKLDPDQREALRALARVRAKLGDTRAARAALAQYAAKHPEVGEPRVLLVQLTYAVEGDVKEADKALRALKSDLPRFDDIDKLMYLTLGAAIARERGDAKASAELAAAALHIDLRYAPAHFQAVLTALSAGDAEEARRQLGPCEARLEPARAAELRGRVEAGANHLDAAIVALRKAAELAPARVAPRLSAAALLYRKGDANAAFSVMRQALDLDPAATASIRRCVSEFYEAPSESVRLAKDAFEGASAEDWLAQTYAAVAQYHLGATDRAAAALDKILQLDPSSLGALLYRAQIELDRKRYDRALELARRAVTVERQSAVAHYLAGRSLEGLKKAEEARAAYLKAVECDPNLVPANLRLGLAAAVGDKEEARKRLLLVTSADPENLEARLALFNIGY